MIEIAFLHTRAVHRNPPKDINERMNALLQHAAALRPYVIMPPPPGRPGPGLPAAPPPGRRPPSGHRAARSRSCGPALRPFRRAGRRTNLALLVVLVGAFLSGWAAFAAGTTVPARLATVGHGLLGIGVLALTPWKTVVVRRAPVLRLASLRSPR